MEWLSLKNVTMIHRNWTGAKSDDEKKLKNAVMQFQSIRPDIIKGLCDIYGKDFDLFGYESSLNVVTV